MSALGCITALAHENDTILKNRDFVPQDSIKKSVKEIIQEKEVELKLYGFIRHDIMYDSRQTVDVREASVLMWPADVKYDQTGYDINSASQMQMLGILSRAGLRLSMNNILKAKFTGVLEGDYFGNAEAGINEFRLRHAWMNLDWGKTQLGIGQFWHPLTIPDMFPGTVNFSGGAPYMPFNRNPQVRLTQQLSKNLMIQATALSQRDFTSNTAPYINSSTPSTNLQLQYKTKDFLFGIAGHYEHIRPKLSSGTLNLGSNERLNSFTGMAFTRINTKPMTIRAQATFAQNGGSFIMLGGFVGYTPNDGGLEVYKTMDTQSYWIDITGNSKKWIPGFFAGYIKNNGVRNNPYHAADGYSAMAYGFPATVSGIGAGNGSRTINYTYRIAPRIEYKMRNLKFGFEPEYSLAQWGDGNYEGTADTNLKDVGNLRLIFATTFTF